MSVEDFERDPLDHVAEFDASKVSPSRVNKLAECGVAFRMKYIDHVPEQRKGSFALNGRVVHKALEKWSLDRSQDLLTLMRQAWLSETEGCKVVRDFLAEYQKINVAVIKAEKAAAVEFEQRNGRPSTAPRMTKKFKESPAARALKQLLRVWAPKLEAGSEWTFTERDPLPQFYDDSLILAKRYEKQWGHLPPSLHTEFSFDVPWRGFHLTGYIDTIEPLVSPDGELQGIGILDYKTYRREPAEHRDYRQIVFYDAAVRWMVEEGLLQLPYSLDDYPLLAGIDYVGQAGVESDWKVLVPKGEKTSGGNSRAFWQATEADYKRLERELIAYRNTVEGRNFLPAPKSCNPDFCDYGTLCCQYTTSQAGGSAERVEVAL